VGGGPSADKSRESGVIRAIDARGGARDASGNACQTKHQTIAVMFAATGMKDLKKRSLPVVLFRRKVAMIISPAALFLRNTMPVSS
jgi:hypothetical protein